MKKSKNKFSKVTAVLTNGKRASINADEFTIQLDQSNALAITYDQSNDVFICCAYPTDKKGKMHTAKISHLDIRPHSGHTITLTASAHNDKYINKAIYEDVNIKDIGNLSKFKNLTVAQLKKRLSKTKRHALYIPTDATPSHWPNEVMQLEKKGKNTFVRWYMNLNGRQWKLLPRNLQPALRNLESDKKIGIIPAMVYEKKILQNNLVSYQPLICLIVNKQGRIKFASQHQV
jgi:hypothetical protein